MEFQFDANQDYQLEAIAAVADLLEGQPRAEVELAYALSGGFAAIPNRLDLTDDDLLANLRAVQERAGLPPDAALARIEGKIETDGVAYTARFPNFSVEMETGTGKTYVYLRTALELHRRYGLRKFIVVVPSVAVREGVLKTLAITEKHLRALYDNVPYRYAVYDSGNLSQVRNFALAESVEMLVMTLDSFNKAGNIIRQSTDRLQGETPINLVRAARPVLILDEPQNMESEGSVRALATLDPLCALRYSATHRNPYNLVYRLTPFDAYRQRLVKRIEVASVIEHNDPSQAFVRVEQLDSQKNTVTAKVTIQKLMKDGALKEQTITVRPGDSLQKKAERPEYAGFEVEEIDLSGRFVRFANNVEVREREARGPDREAIFDAQIRYTLEEHFRRQARLRPAGIKVLSLFFIDRVDNYRDEDGLIRRLFVRAFNDLKVKYPEWRERDVETAQAAYFAQRKKGGAVELVDSTSGKSREDEAAYDLIMKAKERLLSFEEPVAFIFSHSALREGWDNPNVFQICTLNQTTSEVKKRQEIGRGVRLPVDQAGARVRDEQVNVLTVVANESYETYVARLQQEIVEEYGVEGLPPRPLNAREREKQTTRLRKHMALSDDFRELWERIKPRTRYSVSIDSAKLIADVLPAVDAITVRPPRVTVKKAGVVVGEKDMLETVVIAEKTAAYLTGRHPLPNLLDLIDNLLGHTTPSMHLTRRTILRLLERAANKKAMVENPHEFATQLVRIVKDRLADQLAEGIKYTPTGEWYDMTRLLDAEELQSLKPLQPAEKSVYDRVICDSETERAFVEGMEADARVLVYIKMPDWFTVTTPIGEYNPDWAIVWQETDGHEAIKGKKLYLVRETKSHDDLAKLRPDERRKIACGEKHFEGALAVSYAVRTSANELP